MALLHTRLMRRVKSTLAYQLETFDGFAAAKTVLFQMCTAAAVGAAGDVAAQGLERRYLEEGEHPGPLDYGRTLRLVAYRSMQAPVCDLIWRRFDVWYAALTPVRAVVAKVLSDQVLIMPPMITIFFSSQAALEGEGPRGIARRVAEGVPSALTFQVPFWMAVHSVTFSVVPPQWRVLWISCGAVVSNTYLSLANHRHAKAEAACSLPGAAPPHGDAPTPDLPPRPLARQTVR